MGKKSKPYVSMLDLIPKMAEKWECSWKESQERLTTLISTLEDELCREDRVGIQLVNFLTLERVNRPERHGTDRFSKKGEVLSIKIPARRELKVTVGKRFFDRLNPDYAERVAELKAPVKDKKKPKLGAKK